MCAWSNSERIRAFGWLIAGVAAVFWLGENRIGRAQENATEPRPLFPEEIVARGRGFKVTSREVETAYIQFVSNLAARGQVFPRERRAEVEAQLLDRLVVTKALLQRATPGDRAEAAEAAERFIDLLKAEAPSEKAFERQLMAMGLTLEEFERQIHERAISEEVVDREVKSNITLTQSESREYYEANRDQFEHPKRARIRHLLISRSDTQGRPLTGQAIKARHELAELLLKRVRSGENFAELAQEFSDDPASRAKGGELTMTEGSTGAPEFEAAVFSLEPGQTSDLVETRLGFHIIRLLEVTPARTPAFEEVEERVREALVMKKVQARLPDYFRQLKEAMEVTYPESR